MIPIVFGTLEFLFKSGTVANLALVAWTIYRHVGGRRGWQVVYELGTPSLRSELMRYLPKRMTKSDLWAKVNASLPYVIGAIKAWRETK